MWAESDRRSVHTIRRVRMLLFLAAAAVSISGGGETASETVLHAGVGPGFEISLVDGSGRAIEHLEPGPVAIEVDDKGIGHNFHLRGPGVDRETDITGTGAVLVGDAHGRDLHLRL